MQNIVVVTDSSAGITPDEANELGVKIVPIPFTVDGKEYFEDGTLSYDKFFALQDKGADVATSQPSQYNLEKFWEALLNDYEKIIYLPITSGLSASCKNAIEYAKKYHGRVLVVDNLRISVPLKVSVYEAVHMVRAGKTAETIVDYLMETRNQFSIYITLSTLKHLRKGGRITPAAAVLGDMFKLKPILYTRGQNFDKAAIALSMVQAKKKMIAKIKKELQTEFKVWADQGKMALLVAHTAIDDTELKKFHAEIMAEFPGMKILYTDPLCLGIACHTGAGALGFGTCRCDYLN